MTRMAFPDDGSRLAYSTSGSVLRPVPAGSVVSVFTDAGATTVADCLHSGGAPVTGNDPLRVDAYSRLPLWQGPDGVDTLYVVVSGGPATAVYARADDRIDDLDARLTAVEPGGGAAALQVAENLADLDDPAVARTSLGLGTSATRNVGTSAGTTAAGDDSRLSDARTPTAHATSHQPGGSDALAVDAAAGVGSLRTLGTGATQAAPGSSVVSVGSDAWLRLHAGGDLDALIVGAVTRDANGAATSAGVVWPDGTSGTYTATTVSVVFPGAVDAYTVTYAGSPTRTVTQPALTRDSNGAVTSRPAMTVA